MSIENSNPHGDAVPPGGERANLREATLAGIRWTALSRAIAESLALASTVVLAHLVTPAQFGHAAAALTLPALAQALTFSGFGTPLVQRPEIRRAHLECTVLMSLVCGVLLTLAMVVLASALVPVFGEETVMLMQIASASFLFAGIGAVPQAVLQRRLSFGRLSSAEVAGLIVGAGTAIGLALAGLNGEAIVLGAVANVATASIFLVALTPSVRPGWDTRAMREVAGFGLPAAGAAVLYTGYRNVDYLILGARLGAAQVGFYFRAFQLAVEYQRKISNIMLRVAFPVYSRAAGASDMRMLRSRIVRAHATILFPLLALLIATAPVLVPWLFGPAWEPAVLPTQILAVAGMANAVLTGTGPLILAAGRPAALLHFSLVSLVLYATAIFLAVPLGIIGVCVAVVGASIAQLLIAQYFLLDRIAGIPIRALWSDVCAAIISSVALLGVAFPLASTMEAHDLHALIVLPVVGIAGLGVYMLAVRYVFTPAWNDLALLGGRLIKRNRRRSDDETVIPPYADRPFDP